MKIEGTQPIALCLISAIALSVFVFSWQYPIVNDLWPGAVVKEVAFQEIPQAYLKMYLHGNPRLGETFRWLLGGKRLLVALFCVCSLSLLTIFSLVIAHVSLKDWPLIALIFLASLFLCCPVSGAMAAYLPFSCNYVLGVSILLGFLSVYSSALWRPLELSWLAAAIFPFGFAAGMTNEQTVPYAILVVVAFCISRWRNFQWWSLSGAAGLLCGYAALFFAPGQNERYGVDKYSELHLDVGRLLERLLDVFRMMLSDTWPFLIVSALLLAFAVTTLGPKHPRVVIGSVALLGSFGMCAPLVLSPILSGRVFFGSDACVALSLIVLVPVVSSRRAHLVAGAASAAVVLWFLAQGYFLIFSYHDAFVEWSTRLRAQRESGVTDATAVNYERKFEIHQRFIVAGSSRTDPKGFPNTFIARYFGFTTFRYGASE